MIGTTLKHYRIVRGLGHGGMGDVYAAEDLQLRRLVVLKTLPPETASDPERLRRFRREAQAVARIRGRSSDRGGSMNPKVGRWT